jgi:hypothetical protein
MNLADVMDEVGTRLDTITGLRVHAFPPDRLSPPAGWVGYPEGYEFDKTYGRGMDRINNLPAVVAVAKVNDRGARDLVGQYVNGSGAKSVKAVLESGTYTAFHTIRVASVNFDVLTVAGDDYLAALFMIDIAGQGSA